MRLVQTSLSFACTYHRSRNEYTHKVLELRDPSSIFNGIIVNKTFETMIALKIVVALPKWKPHWSGFLIYK